MAAVNLSQVVVDRSAEAFDSSRCDAGGDLAILGAAVRNLPTEDNTNRASK